jgi:hypothetical protein
MTAPTTEMDTATSLASDLIEDRAFVNALGLAVSALVAAADCDRQAAGLDVLIEDLGKRLDRRIDVVEGWAAARRTAMIAV